MTDDSASARPRIILHADGVRVVQGDLVGAVAVAVAGSRLGQASRQADTRNARTLQDIAT